MKKSNITIKGIKAVAGETKCLQGIYGGIHLQLNYNMRTGKLSTTTLSSRNERSVFEDEDIYNLGIISNPMTMKEIRLVVEDWVAWKQAQDRIYKCA